MVNNITIPGNRAVHQLAELYLNPVNTFPQEITSLGSPIPINDRVDSITNSADAKKTKSTIAGLVALGMACFHRI